MRSTALLAAFALCLPLTATAQPKEPYIPGLGEIMTLQQMRHLKLWFASQAGNWSLADYELDELKEGFEDVVKYSPTKTMRRSVLWRARCWRRRSPSWARRSRRRTARHSLPR